MDGLRFFLVVFFPYYALPGLPAADPDLLLVNMLGVAEYSITAQQVGSWYHVVTASASVHGLGVQTREVTGGSHACRWLL